MVNFEREFYLKRIALLAVVSLVFAACFNDWQGDEGSFSVGVGSSDGAVAIINGIPIANFRHVITLSDGPGVDQTMSIDGAGSVTFSVIPGHWTITIKAYVTDRGDGGRAINGDEPLASGSARVEIKPGPNDVITIPMNWRQFTVTFVSNCETEVPDQTLYDGKKASQPQGLTKDNHTLEGWYTEAEFINLWIFDNIVTQNTILYAKWTENPPGYFTVTFVSNGGTEVPDQTVIEGAKAIQPQGVTRSGYTLEGWYTDNYTFTHKWDFDVDVVEAATMLFAQWTENPRGTFTVTFVNNDGIIIPDQIVSEGDKAIQPQGITKDGYTLEGWYTEEAFEYKWNFDEYPITYDLILYARWTENPPGTFTVTFVSNGGTAVPDQTVSVGEKASEPQGVTKEGHTLEGWYRDAALTNRWNFNVDTVSGAITLYAGWSFNTYTVTFMDGDTILTTLTQNDVPHGTIISRPADPTKTGYTFDNWYSNSGLTNLFSFSTPINGNTTIYAKFNINTYSVTFNADGGLPIPEPQTITHGDKVTQPSAMTKAGYGFGGWYKEAALINLWDFGVDTVTGPTTLYAEWSTIFHTVTFHADGGSPAPEPQNIAYNSKVIPPPAMTKTGSTFGGWYREATLTNEWNFNTDTVISDTPLYAKWTLNTYTVTFNADGGLPAPIQQNISYGNKVTQPPAMTKTGSAFVDWYKESTFTNFWDFDTDTVTTNTILYARWIVSVTDIIGVPSVMTVGTPLTLAGTVQPDNATYKTIVWSIKNAGTTSAILNGNTLNATTAETVTVTATIANGIAIGTPYTKDFLISVQKAEIFTFDQITDAAGDLIDDQTISRSGNGWPQKKTLTLDNPDQYESIEWIVTGTNVRGYEASFILDATNPAYGSLGEYFLTLEVWKDGIPYSKTIIFTVVP
jgi:uncharacterized repeat protein (TIGR02543 family)